MDKPIFVGKLTSGYLFERVQDAIAASYQAKKFLDRTKKVPTSIATFDSSSEFIDFLLTQPQTRLTDFLHSQCNTNTH